MPRSIAGRIPAANRTDDLRLLSASDVERIYGIPANTLAVWRSTNRYNFRSVGLKVGRSVRYRREDLEAWLESRRGLAA